MTGRGGIKLPRLSRRGMNKLNAALVDALGPLPSEAPELSDDEKIVVARFGMDVPE